MERDLGEKELICQQFLNFDFAIDIFLNRVPVFVIDSIRMLFIPGKLPHRKFFSVGM